MTMDAVFPAPDVFRAAFDEGTPQVVALTRIADLETPVSVMLKLQAQGEPCFLLESVHGGENRGRYSIIGIKPDILWRAYGEKAEINLLGSMEEEHFAPMEEKSLEALKRLMRDSRIVMPAHLPSMSAGLIGYMGYDMVRQMETLPNTLPDSIGIPDAFFMRPRIMVVFDSVKGVMHIVSPLWQEHDYASAEEAYDMLLGLIQETVAAIEAPLEPRSAAATSSAPMQFTSNTTQQEYHAMVEKAKRHIAAGDIFQVVPSQRFSAPFSLPHFALYRALRQLNPSPFLFYFHFGTFSLVGSSPEILVRLREDTVTIRPIAGTRPRGKTQAEDKALAEELLADTKEIAEHLMLLDLGRNDVGRVALPGSVKVTEQQVIERYSHVMHIVSQVEGTRDPRFDAIDALAAGFPAGTVSGAPKIRAMEIIESLEKEQRSFYAGCVGYFSAGGDMDTCITLRTALLKDKLMYVQAGGGVVIDSDPEMEYQESCNKARAVMRAAEQAHKFV